MGGGAHRLLHPAGGNSGPPLRPTHRKERDLQGFTQESIREAIENARLPDSDLGSIQRFWAEESEKASDEAKGLAKKQTAIREKVAENRKHRKVESTGSSAAQSPNPVRRMTCGDKSKS